MRRREFVALAAGAVFSPLGANAQRKALPVIGYLSSGSSGPSAANVAAFREGLGEAGYVEGQNVTVEYRWAEGDYNRLTALLADLVDRKVDVIAAQSTLSAHAAKSMTSTTPIVFTSGADPVATGLVASLARPGGNLTGVSFLTVELMAKRLELLSVLIPSATVIALLVNPQIMANELMIKDMQQAASAKGVRLPIVMATTESEIDAVFPSIVELQADALVIGTDPFFATRREQLVSLAARHRLPAIYDGRPFAAAGGLLSYGTNFASVYRLFGMYAGKVLNGTKPADLPVQQPTRFELVINLKTAKALGLTIPPSLLARADEVIE
jgi:putative tryptophan/tyrosine transport system substrate-binding protein